MKTCSAWLVTCLMISLALPSAANAVADPDNPTPFDHLEWRAIGPVNMSGRVADVSSEKNDPHVLINPEILELDGKAYSEEGCLSVPGYFEEVERAEHIKVRFLDRDGNEVVGEFEGLLGVCIQHEMDHLDGKLFVDYLSEAKRQRIRKRLEKERRLQAVGA